jgi:hypothetical protein
MGAIDNFLKRWGFAKLDRYGLILTPDDRVISMRPAVLDDGVGGRIVGWLEGDLAAMELDRWGAAKAATAKPVTAPASLHKLPPVARVVAPASPAPNTSRTPRPLPGVAPAPVAVTPPTPIPSRPTAPTPVVAANAEPGEDEWEWEIAMARARAAAEEIEEARVDLLGASAVIASAVIQRKTNPGMAVTAPMPHAVKHPEPEPLPPWPGTEPFNDSWGDKSEIQPQVMSVMEKKLAVARTPVRGSSTVPQPPTLPSVRSTVIPVPQLPTAADPRLVRPAPYTPSQPRGRLARGTGAPGKKLEETVRTTVVAPANDDRTSPYIELPPEVKPSGFAHTKRVASKQR